MTTHTTIGIATVSAVLCNVRLLGPAGSRAR